MNKCLCAVAVFCLFGAHAGQCRAYVEGKRVALVIGNGAYAACSHASEPGRATAS